MNQSSMFNFVMLFLLASIGISVVAENDVLAVLVGETATLKCPISKSCGLLHSVRWYRDNVRIAVLAESSSFVKVEEKMGSRIKVSLFSLEDLKISPVQIDDEGLYKCELTYLETTESCETVHKLQLKTLLKPKSLNVYDQNAKEMHNGSPLGGLLEDTETTVECRADGGKPIPTLTWTLGDKEVEGDITTTGEGEDAVTTNRLIFTVERQLQGKQLRCTVTSEALTDPMESNLTLDLILLPILLTISGVEHHAVQGSKVTLECLSRGARPPAVIMWSNDTQSIPADQTLTTSVPQSDGTYDTTSRLSFWATRWEHNHSFNCESKQLAIPLEQEITLNASHILDVHFPPVVSVRPDNIIVNETMDAFLFCEYEANPMRLLSVAWLQNNKELDLESDPNHYDGASTKQPALLILSTSEQDIGNYSCKLENAVGSTTSPDTVFLDVQFVPEVELSMDPDNYAIESAKQNITIFCNVIKGNPSTLLEVEWYLDQEVLLITPNCNKSTTYKFTDDLCTNVEANRLLLEEAGRSFHGNYSCRGKTLAGWGLRSNDSELIIDYEPGPASLIYIPQKVIKGGSVKLTCSVDEYGRPPATRYQWYRGTQLISDIVTADWTIMPVSLETETNFTCQAVNLAGMGEPAVVYVEVLAPPTFITSLTSHSGMVYNASDISLLCRIECSPLCEIGWMKSGKIIEVSDSDQDLYSILNTPLAPESSENYFESMQSELIFNMSNWPDQVLNRLSDNANYSCFSIDNGVGPVITSSTTISVEFPPENMTVSNKVVSVKEDQVPEKVICSAKGKPEPKYTWKRYNTSVNADENENVPRQAEILSQSYALVLKKGVKRSESGDIVCEASNVHGKIQTTTYLNVMYKPECVIIRTKEDDEETLTCTSTANPTEVDFEWTMEDTNDTINDEAIIQRGSKSILKLEQLTLDESPRNFICVVNNTVGVSAPCTLIVQGILPWWKWWSRTALLVAAGIGILLILVILMCLIIFCICRRKRAASKYNSPTPVDEHDSSQIQNETSIVQAIVSQSIPGISPKTQIPTTPVQYSEKSRLVPLQNRFILPQNKTGSANRNPLAANSTGRLQADLSLLEASYQASLIASKQKALSSTNLQIVEALNQNVSIVNEKSSKSKSTVNLCNNNNNTAEVDDNNLKSNTESQGLTINKWPLKPGVLVHVNSNHSLSPKKFNRTVVKPDETINSVDNDDVEAVVTAAPLKPDKTPSFDASKCSNIMKNNVNRESTFSRIFKKMDLAVRIGKNSKGDESERFTEAEKQECSDIKRTTKSNKMALSLVGFTLKDDNLNKGKGIKSIFQGTSPTVLSSEGVVTFRRPPKNSNNAQCDDTSKHNLIDKSTNDDDIDEPDVFNESRANSGSRKRKKPGEAPMNGAADGAQQGVDNPGVYENLPFHGLQQAPNKPVQVIQPRIVRALVGQNSSKTPESILEKQLECNPSFTPRILSCAPFSHNPNVSSKSLVNSNHTISPSVPTNSSVGITPNRLPSMNWDNLSGNVQNSLYAFPHRPNPIQTSKPINEISNIEGLNPMYEDEDQKFYSLNTKRDRSKKPEPRFSSMKIVRKRKLDRFYPSKHRIDYVVINKHGKKPDLRSHGSREVIYANYPHLSSTLMHNTSGMSNLITQSMNASYQNLTDSIQIHENSPMTSFNKSSSSSSKSEGKTPTPAPRLSKSPIKLEKIVKQSPREHVYANVALHISSKHNSNGLPTSTDHIPITNTPKTLPRRFLKADICTNLVEQVNSTEKGFFNSSTFPKRTTKSGILLESTDEKSGVIKNDVPKGKIISSKTPSRNHSFNDCETSKTNFQDLIVPKVVKADPVKISPSVVDSTPKVKPFVVSAIVQNSNKTNKSSLLRNEDIRTLNSSSDDEKCDYNMTEELEKLGSSIRNFNELQEQSVHLVRKSSDCTKIEQKHFGKVIPKQQMMIQPAKVPLQIPKLLPKPVPKIRPIQLKRSQSSLSGKNGSSEYMQQYKGASGIQDGSLVKAKIRELNLRQPYRPEINDQLIYADADLKDYGPINYKQASIYARMKKIKEQQKMEIARKDD